MANATSPADRRDTLMAKPDPIIMPVANSILMARLCEIEGFQALFIGSIFTPWAIVWGGIPVALAVTIWFWPRRRETRENLALEKRP